MSITIPAMHVYVVVASDERIVRSTHRMDLRVGMWVWEDLGFKVVHVPHVRGHKA